MLDLPGRYTSHFTNTGRGKGVATYYSIGFTLVTEINMPLYQLMQIQSDNVNIINVYRSSGVPASFLRDLNSLIDKT